MRSKLSLSLCLTALLATGVLLSDGLRSVVRGAGSSTAEAEVEARAESGAETESPVEENSETVEPDVQEGWRAESTSLVEVWVDGRPLENLFARGRQYVEALRGAEYELRIRNPYSVRVAVALSVDGLNTIDARRTTRWDSSKWVIEPFQTITIKGWQMSAERARRFYFTHERDSYAARLGRPSDIGTISAVFFRERYTPQPYIPRRTRPYPLEMPRDGERSGAEDKADGGRDESARNAPSRQPAPNASASGGAHRRGAVISPQSEDEYAATGIGRGVAHDVSWINLDLDPRPVAEVNIRYEYRDALVRLGVLPRYTPPSPVPLQRRERARGFSDQPFCPEP